jgi:glucose-6-phosphate 1-dehydrogenase
MVSNLLATQFDPPELPAYGRLLLNVLSAGATQSIRGDEAEESWRLLAPALDAWSKDVVPMEEYAAGSDRPAATNGRRGFRILG